MRIVGSRLYNPCTKLFSTELSLKREICCAARPGERRLCVWAGEGKGAQPAMMLPSVLMMPSRCLTSWEQMGLLCMSAFSACCIVCSYPLEGLRFIVFVYRAQWHTVRCQVLLCRCVVPALSAIIFYHVRRPVFRCSPRQKKKKILAFIYCWLQRIWGW